MGAAFSVEIYLKLMHRLSPKTYDGGHDLLQPFNALPGDAKKLADATFG